MALCLLPDSGHVFQLLRLATRIGQRVGRRVVLFAPQPCAPLARGYPVQFVGLEGIDQRAASAVCAALSRRSRLRVGFSSDFLLAKDYWASLMDPVTAAIPVLLERIQNLHPALMVCDGHVFKPVYVALAHQLALPLIINRAGGTLIGLRRRYDQVFGLSAYNHYFKRFVEFAGWRYNQLALAWARFTDPAGVSRFRVALEAPERIAQRCIPQRAPSLQPQPVEVFAGLAFNEITLRPAGDLPANYVLLPPITDSSDGTPLGPEWEWLGNPSAKPIVLISFGTMVRPSVKLLQTLVRGALAAGARVILSSPTGPSGDLGHPTATDLYHSPFVPQAALLRSGRIAAFVGHGGPGGLCEAISCGVPCLSIPFIWDQSYAASIASLLGVGCTLPRRSVSTTAVRRALTAVLRNPVYAEQARRHSAAWHEALEKSESWAWLERYTEQSSTLKRPT